MQSVEIGAAAAVSADDDSTVLISTSGRRSKICGLLLTVLKREAVVAARKESDEQGDGKSEAARMKSVNSLHIPILLILIDGGDDGDDLQLLSEWKNEK